MRASALLTTELDAGNQDRNDRPALSLPRLFCNHCNHSRKHNSNHLSVHQLCHPWQQLTSPKMCPILETSRHRLVRYYWYSKFKVPKSYRHGQFWKLGTSIMRWLILNVHILKSLVPSGASILTHPHMAMGQNLLLPHLEGMNIHKSQQLIWCEQKGTDRKNWPKPYGFVWK